MTGTGKRLDMPERKLGPRVRAARQAIGITAITFLVFALVEGLSSTVIAFYDVVRGATMQSISQYDELLGWVSIPNAFVADMYGPGKYVRIDARGIRSDSETETSMPEGTIRIICSGDSFAFGQGVANDQTWCHRIAELDPRVETANLGQSGYGTDQAYLRYERDGASVDHSIHLFTFVSGDLDRMARNVQHGVGKPMLRLAGDSLAVENVPVPRFRWTIHRVVEAADLRSVELGQRVLGRLSKQEKRDGTIGRMGPVVAQVFAEVDRLSRQNRSIPVFVYLPTEPDIVRDKAWRQWALPTMDSLELRFLDLTAQLRALPAARANSFFIPRGWNAEGHYTEEGNAWVAQMIYEALMDMPRVNAVISNLRQTDGSSEAAQGNSPRSPIPRP